MPAYNAQKYIQDSIDSVIIQTYPYWQLIIVDDGSLDDTAKICKENAAKDKRIICLKRHNGKQAAARNTGIIKAEGEWIAFIDSDDIWYKEKLECQLEYINEADIIYSSGIILLENDKTTSPYLSKYGFYTGEKMFDMLFSENHIPNLSVMIKSDWIKRVGFQNESLDMVGCEDWEYLLRLARNGATFYGINKELFTYRQHEASISGNFIQMKIAELFAKKTNADPTLIDQKKINYELNKCLLSLYSHLILNKYGRKEIKKQVERVDSIQRSPVTKRFYYLLNNFSFLPQRIFLSLLHIGYKS